MLWQDNRGNLISGGVDMSFPTGPTTFAGYPTTQGINAFEFQPFLGYIFQRDQDYVQGFSSIAVPTDRNLATMYYFDIAAGVFRLPIAESTCPDFGDRPGVRDPPEHPAELGRLSPRFLAVLLTLST